MSVTKQVIDYARVAMMTKKAPNPCPALPVAELTTTQRVTQITQLLMMGWTPKTREVAERYGMSRPGAWDMLNNMSGVLPLTQDAARRWRIVGVKPCVGEHGQLVCVFAKID